MKLNSFKTLCILLPDRLKILNHSNFISTNIQTKLNLRWDL